MAAQDDERERQMVGWFNLTVADDRGRADVDAHLDLKDGSPLVPFELKSTTTGSVSTVRDFGPEHIEKWKDLHWVFGVYDGEGTKLRYCHYGSPADMAAWIEEKQEYIRTDLLLVSQAARLVTDDLLTEILGPEESFSYKQARSVMKKQWSVEQYKAAADLPKKRYSRPKMLEILQERCGYVIRRGSTLNNPHISKSYLDALPRIDDEHAATLRKLVRAFQDSSEPDVATVDPVVAAAAAGGQDLDLSAEDD